MTTNISMSCKCVVCTANTRMSNATHRHTNNVTRLAPNSRAEASWMYKQAALAACQLAVADHKQYNPSQRVSPDNINH
jgi:hypothetical protein